MLLRISQTSLKNLPIPSYIWLCRIAASLIDLADRNSSFRYARIATDMLGSDYTAECCGRLSHRRPSTSLMPLSELGWLLLSEAYRLVLVRSCGLMKSGTICWRFEQMWIAWICCLLSIAPVVLRDVLTPSMVQASSETTKPARLWNQHPIICRELVNYVRHCNQNELAMTVSPTVLVWLSISRSTQNARLVYCSLEPGQGLLLWPRHDETKNFYTFLDLILYHLIVSQELPYLNAQIYRYCDMDRDTHSDAKRNGVWICESGFRIAID